MNIWKRKLLAYLHDPPSKPFNLKEHGEIAESLIRAAGFEDAGAFRWFFDKVCDHSAAAADRLAFPKPAFLACEFNGGPESPFHHPMGGGQLEFENPISPEQAETLIAQAQPTFVEATKQAFSEETELWRARFFLHWRLWRQHASVSRQGLAADARLALLPADTRIPDHSTWVHCGLVSALQGCVEVEEHENGGEIRSFDPAFLLMQIGPVQEFIAQARSTRDLWSGSYLLSWLVAAGIKSITDEYGPDCILFPSLWGQPLFDALHSKEIFEKVQTAEGKTLWDEIRPSGEQVLTPNLPNRFLAVLPRGCAARLAAKASEAMHRMLTEEISSACLEWLKENQDGLPEDSLPRWRQQLRDFLQIHWQVWPWEKDIESAIRSFESLPMGKVVNDAGKPTAESLRAAYHAAIRGMPDDHLDPRNYRHRNERSGGSFHSSPEFDANGMPVVDNPGFAWAAHYQQTDFLLAARRQTREFNAWGDPQDKARRHGASRDQLSGKEEIVGPLDWQDDLVRLSGHRFRSGERFGAMNLIKRLWDQAYLSKEGFDQRTISFDSVPAVAASPWIANVRNQLRQSEECWRQFIQFTELLAVCKQDVPDVEIPQAVTAGSRYDESRWLDQVDAQVFHSDFWRNLSPEITHKPTVVAAARALAEFKKEFRLGEPSRYFAVLALDGDEMGKWISGAKSPMFREQLAAAACRHFERKQDGAPDPEALSKLLDHPRHLSPSYHLQFSEALCNFSVLLAPAIVDFYNGQLIYAGGDDVLAMLPATQAMACAVALRLAFQGSDLLVSHLKKGLPDGERVPILKAQDGFFALDGKWEGFRRNRQMLPRGLFLVAPGTRATVSAGISIGHIREPLQDMVREAQLAEKRAKGPSQEAIWNHHQNRLEVHPALGWHRDAVAVTLFKRSGETIQWGAKFQSPAFDLLETFQRYYRERLDQPERPRPISGKFPYRLAEMLGKFGGKTLVTDQIVPIVEAELRHVIDQQTRAAGEIQPKELQELRRLIQERAHKYLEHLRNFDLEKAHERQLSESQPQPRPLAEFYNLFLLEAFIARIGE